MLTIEIDPCPTLPFRPHRPNKRRVDVDLLSTVVLKSKKLGHSLFLYSLLIILTLTAQDRAICASVSPLSRRAMASLRWKSESLGLRPERTPFCIARFRPSPVRSGINSRSNSAMAGSMVTSKRSGRAPRFGDYQRRFECEGAHVWLLRVSRSRKRVTVFEDHCLPVALLIPRRFSSAAICRADGKWATAKIGLTRSASSPP